MTKTTVYALRLCMLLLFAEAVYTQPAMAQAQQEKKITLKQAVEAVEKKFGTKFAYEHNLLEGKYTTTKALEGESASDVLKNILYPNNLIFLYVSNNSYSIVARNSSFFTGTERPAAPAQQAVDNAGTPNMRMTVRGQVTDMAGTPLPFVNIWVKGTNNGTQTNDRGDYTLANVNPMDSLVYTYVGFHERRIIVDGRSNIVMQMPEDAKSTLGEVVVSTGLQTLPKERATGSYGVVTAKDLEKVPVPNVIQRLEGAVPGLKINLLTGDRSFLYSSGNQLSINGGTHTVGNNDYSISIRGNSTFIGETFPLVVVDGAITELDLSTLNPNDVDNITFLKDAAAASIWGVRAANGVIVVTTKKGKNAAAPDIRFSAGATVSGRPRLNYMRTMNSAQQIGYETELVNRGFITQDNLNTSAYYYATYYPQTASALALKRNAGTITQDTYNKSIDSLSSIDNRSQVQHYFFQPAANQQYNLSIAGGSGASSYYYAGSYSRETPNSKGDIGQRLTLTMNNSWTLFKVATLSTSLKGSFFNYTNNGFDATTLYKPNSATLLPYDNIADANGNGVEYYRLNPDWIKQNATNAYYKKWTYNYLEEKNNLNNTQKDNNYVANINLKVPIYKGLAANVLYTNEKQFSELRNYNSPQSYAFRNVANYNYSPSTAALYGYSNLIMPANSGIYSINKTTQSNYALRGQLSYDRTIHMDHQINAIAGSEIRQTDMGQSTGTLYGYNPATGISSSVNYYSSYATLAGYGGTLAGAPTQFDKRRRFISYFSNAAYTYKRRYSFSASVRYDDYNNFGLDRKYRATPLWSVGGKWQIADEAFMKDVKWISNLGLRATYGINGNISTSLTPYTYIAYNSSPDYYTNYVTSSIINLANPQLKWEKTYMTNIGLDFGFLNSKLTGSIDFYNKAGRDLYYQFPIDAAYAGSIGGYYLTRNASSLNGKGVDLGLNAVVYSDKNWTVRTGGTFSWNVNKVVEKRFDTSALTITYKTLAPNGINYVNGYSMNSMFVFRNAGLDANGLTQVYNSKGTKMGTTQTLYFNDLKYAGRKYAPYYGSYNANITFKRFNLYALFTYQFGNVFLKPSINNYITQYYSLNYDISADIAKRWQNPGDESKTNVPGLNGTATNVANSLTRYQNSDINVLKGDYVRFREVSLSYQLPALGMVSRIVKDASLAFAVRNLGLLWTANKQGYDPDYANYPGSTYGLPPSKSYTLTLNVHF